MSATWRIIQGDAEAMLATLPAASVHCVVTSPPYFALRDYGVDGQIGLDATPAAYLARLVAVFEQVKRVLHPSGVLWVNLGDSYNAYNGNRGIGGSTLEGRQNCGLPELPTGAGLTEKRLPAKNLLGMPWRLAFALQDAGWILRQEIIWEKGSCMPESVTDRCTRSHEQVFMFAKQPRYFYDAVAIREDAEYGRRDWTNTGGNLRRVRNTTPRGIVSTEQTATVKGADPSTGRNARTVWHINPEPFSVRNLGNGYTPPWEGQEHYAAFPSALAARCLLAGSSQRGVCPTCLAPWRRVVEREKHPARDMEAQRALAAARTGRRDGHVPGPGGLVDQTWTTGWAATCTCNLPEAQCIPATILDPFLGTGTTIISALRHGRSAVGIDLSAAYCDLARHRIIGDAALNALTEGTT